MLIHAFSQKEEGPIVVEKPQGRQLLLFANTKTPLRITNSFYALVEQLRPFNDMPHVTPVMGETYM